MARPLYTNNAASSLAAGITSTQTTIQLSDGMGNLFPTPVGGDYFYATIVSVSLPVVEIVKCTARSGDYLTVVRGEEGTVPLPFNINDGVQLRITAAGMNFLTGQAVTSTEEETQTATQGQTVFTLVNFDYATGTNNLAVFVNGSKQVSGVNYSETNVNTVTFNTGLNAGDIVEFLVGVSVASGTLFANDVQYNEGETGAVTRTVASKLQESVSVKDFGAVGDGVTNDTSAFGLALEAAKGGYVFVPIGEYLITSPLDSLTTNEIRLIGPSSAFASHTFINSTTYQYSSDFSPASIQDINSLKTRFATIKCSGTNMFGSADGANVGTKTTLRHLANLCIYGADGAEIGLYLQPEDALIENCNIALFEKFGICIRGGITSTFRKISCTDNGWNLAESGSTTWPATYVSGCQINLVSNFTPNDFATIDSAYYVTTMSFENIYANVRGYITQNMSGYRGIQVHGCYGLNLDDIGSYTGHYFNLAIATGSNIYVECYSLHGLTAASIDPYAIYAQYSNIDLGSPFLTMNGVPTQPALYASAAAQTYTSSSIVRNNGKSNITYNGSVTSKYESTITVVTPGSTVNYSPWDNVIPDTVGFHGIAIVNIMAANDTRVYANAVAIVHKHTSGATQLLLPATLLNEYHSGTGAYLNQITGIDILSNGAIQFGVNWGASYSASDSWVVNAALIGADIFTTP